jgi:hypothetical protein
MLRRTLTVFALTLGIAFSLPALAADGHGHRHGYQPMHAGIVAEVGDNSYELVARADSLTLYIFDHGKPVATEGAQAEIVLHGSSEKIVVPLQSAGENRMTAKGDFKVGVGVRAALTVRLAGKAGATATFRLK